MSDYAPLTACWPFWDQYSASQPAVREAVSRYRRQCFCAEHPNCEVGGPALIRRSTSGRMAKPPAMNLGHSLLYQLVNTGHLRTGVELARGLRNLTSAAWRCWWICNRPWLAGETNFFWSGFATHARSAQDERSMTLFYL